MGSQHKVKTSIICFFMILALSGCGGGGGDNPPANIAPVANAGPDQTVNVHNPGMKTITLTGTTSDSDGTVVTHQWVQTGGAAVTLTGAATSTATFSVSAATDAYSFSYTVTDDDGAQGSNTVAVYVTEIIFSDTFDGGSDWTPVDDTGNGAVWAVVNGELRQTSHLESPDLDGLLYADTSYHLGTYAHLDDPAISGISSYRFSVDITPLLNNLAGETEGNDIGIMFGYQGPGSYYRVSMNARYGFTRFEKRVDSNFETLAVNAIGYVHGQSMTMTAEVNSDTTIVWIDGDPIFAVVDSAIPSGTVALYCQDRAQFDNVLITENPLQPMVAISSPLAYSVTPGNLVDLTVAAVVLNKPADGSVAFSLDGGSEITVAGLGNLYSHLFTTGVFNGNYDVAAIVRNADSTEASSDTNSMVGTGGDYYVTVGDSITNGFGDEDDSNNDSVGGRMVAIQGYQARLSNLLTADTGRPQIVFNEGIPGDEASDLESRIDSILERHPGANKVLMMIGINDSGSGVHEDTFGPIVNSVANTIVADGKQVWLAQILPTNPPSLDPTQDNFIKQYNVRIYDIATEYTNDDIDLGPNFYTDFFNNTTRYADTLHPNDDGYRFMADRWALPLP